MKKLTERQRQIFAFIKSHIEEYGYSPTSVEIGDHFEIYPNGAWEHVKALVKKGVLTRAEGKMRSLQVSQDYEH